MTGMSNEARPPDWLARGRVPGLDGLRAISVALVLLAHVIGTRGFPRPAWLTEAPWFGGLGVDVFFVISGFLITLLLLREREGSGAISLRGFYARRCLRILPAYAAYLAFVAALVGLGQVAMKPIDWLSAITYTVNFRSNTVNPWVVSHLWSLSVEEHFYLAWPLGLVVLGRRGALALLLAAMAAAPAVRPFLWEGHWDIGKVTPARIDTIGMGCLLAYVASSRRSWRFAAWMERWGAATLAAAVPLLILSGAVLSTKGRYAMFVARTVEAGLIAWTVLACAMTPRSRVGRVLNARPMVLMGGMSYSLYLWQQAFLNPTSAHAMCRWPLNLALAVIAAWCSWTFVEQPFLRLKARMTGISPSRRVAPTPHAARKPATARVDSR